MKFDQTPFLVTEGKRVRLTKLPTRLAPLYASKKDYHRQLAAGVGELTKLQRLLYASDRYSVLLIFQSMDTAGKDGVIAHLLTGVNPQGCEVHSFKHPSAEELDHDFLWRTTAHLPTRGRLGVFNRSYYEEVLIVRVHPTILRSEGIPPELLGERSVWQGRYRSIVNLEKHLHRNGTVVLKFFLHLSKNEQRKRLLARIDDPAKNWKIGPADVVERRSWDRYQSAYEDCLRATGTKSAPWHIVPADDKFNARLAVARVVIAKLQSLRMRFPTSTRARKTELAALRRELAS